MPSYIEGDNIEVIVNGNKTMIKPILFTTYDSITTYNLHITYEDDTSKDVELVQKCKDRPYKFIYKKEGKLLESTGIPTIYEINEKSKYTDFANTVMDSNDLLFIVDCSTKYESIETKFYLKDIRDIVDLSKEDIVDPEDPMDIFPVTMYPMYLNGYSCENIIKLQVDDSMLTTLTPEITKMGEVLPEEEYSDFEVLSISDQDIIYEVVDNNIINLYMTENTLDKEIKITVKCFIKEINHPIFDEFTFIVSKKDKNEDNVETASVKRAVTTQDMQYLGDGLETGLGNDLTPGFKPFRYRKKKVK